MEKKLLSRFIKTVKEIKESPDVLLSFGRPGKDILGLIYGLDTTISTYHKRKSIGISRTFDPIADREEVMRRARVLVRHLSYTIAKLRVNPTTFYFKIRYDVGLKSKISFTRDRIFSEKLLQEMAEDTFKKLDIYHSQPIMFLAISTSNFTNDRLKTLSLIEYEKDKKSRQLYEASSKIRNKYGVDAIVTASERVPREIKL